MRALLGQEPRRSRGDDIIARSIRRCTAISSGWAGPITWTSWATSPDRAATRTGCRAARRSRACASAARGDGSDRRRDMLLAEDQRAPPRKHRAARDPGDAMSRRTLARMQDLIECRRCARASWPGAERVAVESGAPTARRLLGPAGPGLRRSEKASLVIVRLAPAATARRGRTGRMFTGDRSGDFL